MQKLTIYYENKVQIFTTIYICRIVIKLFQIHKKRYGVYNSGLQITPLRGGENGTARPELLPHPDRMTENVVFYTILSSHCSFKSNVTLPNRKACIGKE